MSISSYAPLPPAATLEGRPSGDGAAVLSLIEGHMMMHGGHSASSAKRNIGTKLEGRTLLLQDRVGAAKSKGSKRPRGELTRARPAVALRLSLRKLKQRVDDAALLSTITRAQAEQLTSAWATHCEATCGCSGGRQVQQHLAMTPMHGACVTVTASRARLEHVGMRGVIVGENHGSFFILQDSTGGDTGTDTDHSAETGTVVSSSSSKSPPGVPVVATVPKAGSAFEVSWQGRAYGFRGDHWVGRFPVARGALAGGGVGTPRVSSGTPKKQGR